MPGAERTLVLASASRTRRCLLSRAGVAHRAEPARIDETALKRAAQRDGTPAAEIALALARAKALDVAPRYPDAVVVGADQVLVLDRTLFDKPESTAAARETLLRLCGRSHRLISAVAAVDKSRIVWHHVETARLVMRNFSEAFLDAYLDAVGEAALESVGAYQLEDLGAQLFSEVEGDYFTILGLPLLPLLDFLRNQGLVKQ
ncbi:MAG: Maf family nucleotide pyrophosphatase [Alphaproteobacteria bacterium]|jgi:septum formation protein|nr:Maf family nucleotide pyrophosphatase [Alphaproteobacteria bacterium]